MIIQTIDPGLNRSGNCYAVDGKIQIAETKSVPVKHGDRFNRAHDMVILLTSRVIVVDKLVVEFPQVYQERKRTRLNPKTGKREAARQDPNDLLPLAAICLGVAVAVRAVNPACELVAVAPRAWKGQLPKKLPGGLNPVKFRSQLRLSPAEMAAVGELAHDGWDAIGLMLWTLGRWSGRVFAGAT